MLQYGVYTKNRFRGLFDDLDKAAQYAGEIAIELGLDAADMHIRDSLENKRGWNAIDRDKKSLLEPTLHLSSQSQGYLERYFKENNLGDGNDHVWIEPGGDVHCFQAKTGCSSRLGTVDDLLRIYLASHLPTEDVGYPRSAHGSAGCPQ